MLPSGAPSPAAHIVHASPASACNDVSTWYLLNRESSFCSLFGLSTGLPAPSLAFSTGVGKNTDFRDSWVVLLIKCYRMERRIYILHSPFALMSYFLFMSGQIFFSLLYSGKMRRKWRAGLYISEANMTLEELWSQDLDTREVISSKPFFAIMIPVSNIKMRERKTMDRTYLWQPPADWFVLLICLDRTNLVWGGEGVHSGSVCAMCIQEVSLHSVSIQKSGKLHWDLESHLSAPTSIRVTEGQERWCPTPQPVWMAPKFWELCFLFFLFSFRCWPWAWSCRLTSCRLWAALSEALAKVREELAT